MRFDVRQGRPAAEWLSELTEEELTALFRDYGEEPHAARIARHLVERRRRAPIHTAADLAQAVEEALPARLVAHARKEPATRVFQALRIHTNQELHQLESALAVALPACVKPGGIAAVISFHSLEDRLVKQAFRDPRTWHNLTPKPLTASATEVRANPRSRTAKLRAARRIPAGDPTT
jgi:16S rRNA (cytosine1402-N4)-methyltransferase